MRACMLSEFAAKIDAAYAFLTGDALTSALARLAEEREAALKALERLNGKDGASPPRGSPSHTIVSTNTLWLSGRWSFEAFSTRALIHCHFLNCFSSSTRRKGTGKSRMSFPSSSIPATHDVSTCFPLGEGYVLQRIRMRACREAISEHPLLGSNES